MNGSTVSHAVPLSFTMVVHAAIHGGGGYLGMVRMRDPMDLLADGSLGDG